MQNAGFLINGIVYTNERDVNIEDNAYVLDHDENKIWNFGIKDGHRELDEEEKKERAWWTVYTRLFLLSVEEIIFSLRFFLSINVNK